MERTEQLIQYTFRQQIEHAIFEVEPSNVGMWVKTVGNPNEVHQKIMEMYGVFLNLCDKLQVKAWLLFGSIIGYIRHKGIIPWEWDMDVGVSTADYEKLLKQQTEYKDENWEFVFYADPPIPGLYKGYPGETFCFRNKNTKLLVDICEYKEIGNDLVPQVPEGYDPADYDTYPTNEIYPLQRVNLVGFGAWLPKNVWVVLKWYGGPKALSWYDPVPLILTKLFNPQFTELLCQPCTKDIPEVLSFNEGMEKYGKKGFSFVVRNIKGIDLTLEMFYKYKMLGWSKDGSPKFEAEAKELIEQWQLDKLQINFVDSSAPNVTTLSNCELGKYINDKDLMLILSNNHTYTPFHVDAVDGYYEQAKNYSEFKGWVPGGGGWMYLHKGQKLWQILHPKFFGQLYNKQTNKINDLPVHELLYLNKHVIWGELEVTELNSGDFIYFAPGYLHRVWTYQKSFGLGGYFDFPGNEPNKLQAKQFLKDAGVDVDVFPGTWV